MGSLSMISGQHGPKAGDHTDAGCSLCMDRVEAKSKGINCFTCTATANNPLKCTRPEYQGTYKKCEGEALAPANTCYKSVNTKTGEVNKGCAPKKWNHDMVFNNNVGPNGEEGVKTYY